MSTPFTVRNLSVLAYANGFTLWHYKAMRVPLATVKGDNYLADAADMLTAGDIIVTSAIDGATCLVVTFADANTVNVAALS